jgi:DNA segregation ATPase FtsK/SpoIIIE, S-DNA-T family
VAKSTRPTKKTAPSRPGKSASSTRSKTTARKPPAAKPKRTPSRAAKPAPRRSKATGWSWGKVSNERKIDVLGVIMALVGLLTLLSLMSNVRGEATGLWIAWLGQLAGKGAFVLPIALILVGVWLIFRNLEQLPQISFERILGLILLYWNILTILHMVTGGTFVTAAEAQGGGYIGAFFARLLTLGFGFAGAVVAVIAWFLIALAFTFDVSISELFRFLKGAVSAVRAAVQQRQQGGAPPPAHPVLHGAPPEAGQTHLPPNFQPLKPTPGSAAANRPISTPRAVRGQPGGTQASPAAPAPGEASSIPQDTGLWTLPKVHEMLDPPTEHAVLANTDKDRARLIEDTLASFGAPAHVVDIARGPTVTQFGVEPDFIENRSGRMRVRVSKIANLADDLALALAAPRIRIQAPVPGRSYVGIEVPNTEASPVSLREIMEADSFKRMRAPLRFAVGKDVAGKPIAYDLAAMPHLLIAGTTGSGKSVCVNAILGCFLSNNTPADLKLVLVDPKRVELTGYNGIPHLLERVITDAEKVVGALQWMLREMDARYHRFSREGVRNIVEYNGRHPNERIPYIVVVIDELADLMMLAPDETERSITRLAQLARATGIHLILATQRPSVDVVTGLIKANFPARIAFAVASGIDSRVILDQPGAERLLGRGDMLFQAPDASAPVRLQGVYVSDSETQRLVDFWRYSASEVAAAQPTIDSSYNSPTLTGVPLYQAPLFEDNPDEGGDPLMKEAVELVRREGRASITMLQRRMRIGYTRAARLIDTMEDRKIIGPSQSHTQVREVLDYGQTAPPEEE